MLVVHNQDMFVVLSTGFENSLWHWICVVLYGFLKQIDVLHATTPFLMVYGLLTGSF